MPLVANNIRHNVFLQLQTGLKDILTSNGYNHDVTVVEGYEAASASINTATVYVKLGNERFGEPGVSGRQECSLELLIFGIIRHPSDGDLMKAANGLLQDVRNAVVDCKNSIHASTGATLMGFDECETDEGALSHRDRAFFMQPVTYLYVAGSTW